MNDLLTPAERYDYAASVLLRHEGLFTNHPSDPGGATNYGISLRFLKAAGLDINLDGEIDISDIMALDKEKAKAVYKKFWWDKYHYEAINDLPIATKVFDLAVNMGAKQAHLLIQRAVNSLEPSRLIVDGILGGKSFGAINGLCQQGHEANLLIKFKEQACRFYNNLVDEKPELGVFLKGWLRRAND